MVVRAVARRLRGCQVPAKCFHSTPAFQQAVPAIRKPSSKGWLSWLFREPVPQLPSLCDPLPNVTLPPDLDEHVAPAETKVTQLSNGIRIATEQMTGATASMGMYIASGSVNETSQTSGATHLLERMAFKSTKNRTYFRLIREAEAFGANVAAGATREQMCYNGDFIKTYMPRMVELLVDTVRNPVFYKWEVEEQKEKILEELKDLSDPQTLILEALHSAAYDGPLGQPLLASPASISKLDGPTLSQFVAENYTPPRIVLAACGVDHQELVDVAESVLSDWPAEGGEAGPSKSKYLGGDWRTSADSPATHVALAFEVPGGWRNEKNAFAVTVLQTLMGGGGSFSSGGPGKGMYSRLYTRVLNKYEDVQSFTAFNSIYNDTGLFGIHATGASQFSGQLVDLATSELLAVSDANNVTSDEVERAKQATISSVLMNLESRNVISEDIGRQILTYGQRKGVQEFVKAVEALTVEDIAEVAKKIVSSPLTMASWGDVVHVPRYDVVACHFR